MQTAIPESSSPFDRPRNAAIAVAVSAGQQSRIVSSASIMMNGEIPD
jgi:hypothetical protein